MKEKEFAERENRNPRLSVEDWLQRYLFTDMHESFFATLPNELHAWFSILVENDTFRRRLRPTEWTQEVIQRLEQIDNPISHLLDGFVTKIAVDTLKDYNKVERYFFKGYQGKYLKTLSLSIKMLLCEKGKLRMDA